MCSVPPTGGWSYPESEVVVQVFEEYCILELMGHGRAAGLVKEVNIAGQGFLRIDVPDADGNTQVTQFLNPTSIYRMTPVEKAIAVEIVSRLHNPPVQRYELRRLMPPELEYPEEQLNAEPPYDDDEEDEEE
jgi:hypothetical protein